MGIFLSSWQQPVFAKKLSVQAMKSDEENESLQVPWLSKCIPFHLNPNNVDPHVQKHEI